LSKLKTKKYNAVANAEKDASQTFVKGAAILTLSMVIVKVFGLLDKVILTGIFSGVSFEQAVAGGTETVNFASFGLGLYSNAYEIFVVIFTVATGGLPIAISRLVSESTAQKRFNDVKQIHRVSIPFFVIVGILSFAIDSILHYSFSISHRIHCSVCSAFLRRYYSVASFQFTEDTTKVSAICFRLPFRKL
jgi:stage V sporulation protein B